MNTNKIHIAFFETIEIGFINYYKNVWECDQDNIMTSINIYSIPLIIYLQPPNRWPGMMWGKQQIS